MELLDSYNRKLPSGKAEEIVFSILDDLLGRRGLDSEWDQIDDETKEEIIRKNISITEDILNCD